MIGKSKRNFTRWTERAKGAAMVGAIAAGVASGYAFAISPTVDTGRDFAGGVNIVTTGSSSMLTIYSVPPGQQYTLTDVVATNNADIVQAATIFIGPGGNCDSFSLRLNTIKIPPQETLHIPLNTGLGFGAGKSVCLSASTSTQWTIRGYLSNES